MFGIMEKYRSFIVEEKDVTTILKIVNHHRNTCDCYVGNCNWNDDRSKWFIHFYATDKIYGQIVKDMKKIGKFNVEVRPGGQVDIMFEMGS